MLVGAGSTFIDGDKTCVPDDIPRLTRARPVRTSADEVERLDSAP